MNDSLREIVKTLVYAVLLALVFRSVLYAPFHIPSGSMKSTLLVGDYLFVSKFSYGYSRYSFPLGLPIFKGRIFGSAPERGDIVVFRLPSNPSTDFIKRVIGLPGDTIQVKSGIVYLNGNALPRQRDGEFVETDPATGHVNRIPRFVETLPNGVTYHVLDENPAGALDNTMIYRVPEGQYFMMGDNRDNSQDSRVLNFVGYIPEEYLVGRAELIAFSSDGSTRFWEVWNWFSSLRLHRFFLTLDHMHNP